ncbi:hypothetical protein FRUB_06300 [Fimbriiglobus ruber]|uniref:Uncharacterized protein n=1 Tax=Fimbriiglobus ruber TaxID=1908690 RepID=A0A225DKV6_9BACT|nr:hypothetical protein FRUB_06300 [Fimbriiglobus ruber]
MTPTGTDFTPLYPELTRRFDGLTALGYLNFSDGRPDPRFRKALADAFGFLIESGDPAPGVSTHKWLAGRLDELHAAGTAAFRDVSQVRDVLAGGFETVPAAYRAHHADLLAHQPDGVLFNPFFLARCCEVALAERAAGRDPAGAIRLLNDFVGYRPIAVLETRPQTDYYAHEKVCPVPIYFRGVGVAPGRYADLVRPALELLEQTDSTQLEEACFDPAKLDELAFDPRAIDHFHPVNKRPSVLFGEWDPHRIDGRGYFRRFVLRQPTLDTLLQWVDGPAGTTAPANRADRLFEASAALCGTILMGAGVSGAGPNYYDSTVTLSSLVQRIARYRDDFYKRLLAAVPGPLGDHLRAESARLKQPFAPVRQFLNQSIAVERAVHLQERRLALLFASMGYPTAARGRAAKIPAPAARFGSEIRLRQTEASFAIRAGRLANAHQLMSDVEDLLNRGIDCGALIDPWNILGYQGLFPIYPGRDDTVRDPRAEDLILTIGRQFDLYAQGLSAAAAGPDRSIETELRSDMRSLAGWWDKFATTAVTDLPRVQGGERTEAADHVAKATALWKTGGATDQAFWRRHREGFKTPAAFAQVIDALLTHGDYRAALALLVTWLGEADTVSLQDPSASFFRLAFRWLHGVTGDAVPAADRGPLVRRFFELLEANADDRWTVPDIGAPRAKPHREETDDQGDDDEEGEDDTFASAYEDVTFRDSADDGQEGAVADGGGAPAPGDFVLDGEAERAEDRLRFLAAVARLWRAAARPDLWPRSDSAAATAAGDWLRTARDNLADLHALIERLYKVNVPEPTGGVEGVMEFDRRRAVKGHLLELAVQTAVETGAAARALAALLSRAVELPAGDGGKPDPTRTPVSKPTDTPAWGSVAVRLERAVASGDKDGARRLLVLFVSLFKTEPLLVSPPADGGPPGPAVRAQTALQVVESLLARLPRLGLLRETYQLTKLARAMERNDPPEGRRVSSFDQLFRTAVTGVVDALLNAAREWGEDAAEDGPLASAVRQVAESFQALWVDHSVGLRLSALEAVLDADDWAPLRTFLKTYGDDLFTVRFLTLSNVRGILGQGVTSWLDREATSGDPDNRPKLVADWADEAPDRTQAARQFEIVLQALVEHYDEYRDYNTTTTQSDYGENLYILLDFLRLKVDYDRYAWRLRPLVLTHEVLCRRGFDRLASKWREFIAARTDKLSKELMTKLEAREAEHAIKLRTVRDRLEEGFVQPLRIDQAAARVARAATAARDGQPEDNPSFTGLLAAIQPLADHPSGVGLDVPAWLRRLEDELRKVRATDNEGDPDAFEQYPFPTAVGVDYPELKRQLQDWEKPIGE